ncbi:MAG: GntR family transcriptional regulator [Actinobacteria bacterium]|nr:GntR family transcriptional regulator [Actinomycetota bacterium]
MDLDPLGEVPLYVQLADLLREQIRTGEIPAGRAIPSRAALKREHGVGGQTINRAVSLLRDDGLVRWSRGKGLYVVPPEERKG